MVHADLVLSLSNHHLTVEYIQYVYSINFCFDSNWMPHVNRSFKICDFCVKASRFSELKFYIIHQLAFNDK